MVEKITEPWEESLKAYAAELHEQGVSISVNRLRRLHRAARLNPERTRPPWLTLTMGMTPGPKLPMLGLKWKHNPWIDAS